MVRRFADLRRAVGTIYAGVMPTVYRIVPTTEYVDRSPLSRRFGQSGEPDTVAIPFSLGEKTARGGEFAPTL